MHRLLCVSVPLLPVRVGWCVDAVSASVFLKTELWVYSQWAVEALIGVMVTSLYSTARLA
jgi:hypothetical protein